MVYILPLSMGSVAMCFVGLALLLWRQQRVIQSSDTESADALDDPVIVRLVPYDADDVADEGDGGFHHRRLAGVQSRREEQRQSEGARQERRGPDCCGAEVAIDEISGEALQEGALVEDAHGLEGVG